MGKHGSGTTAVRGGRPPGRGPLTTPVVQSSTFGFASAAEMRQYLEGDDELYIYTRYANPTLRELEEALAALEEAEAGLVLSSGMAAMATALLSLVRSGDEILDIRAIAKAAHARDLVIVADNTFATPFLQRPLALGVDLVMHSLTKALAGHSDVVGGALQALEGH